MDSSNRRQITTDKLIPFDPSLDDPALHDFLINNGINAAVAEHFTDPAWSPNGQWITSAYYVSIPALWEGKLTFVPSDLYSIGIVDAKGSGKLITLTQTDGLNGELSWAHDGKTLANATCRVIDPFRFDGPNIYLYGFESGQHIGLTDDGMSTMPKWWDPAPYGVSPIENGH